MQEIQRYYRSKTPLWVQLETHRRLRRSGRMERSFPDCPDLNAAEFLELVNERRRPTWFLTFREEPAGMYYLTGQDGTCARIHFAFLPLTAMKTRLRLPVPVALARFGLATVLRDRADGEYILDSVIGVTPLSNKPAIKTVLRCHPQVLGRAPAACPRYGRRNEDGLVTAFTRQTTKDDWCFQ